jgi:hypothetical protein
VAQGQELIPWPNRSNHWSPYSTEKVFHMDKKKSKIDIAREIIANLQVEMNKPRVTESVRNGFRVHSVTRIKTIPVRPF